MHLSLKYSTFLSIKVSVKEQDYYQMLFTCFSRIWLPYIRHFTC